MAKMDDDTLLQHLQRLEDDAATFAGTGLEMARQRAQREYFRMPYGTEEEGWSNIVTSDVQDTVEGILPDLLDIFTGSDEAVVFEPQEEKDVQGAQQATDACNYVFYKSNNGFLVLYTAFKDALLEQNCAVMWRKHTEKVRTIVPVNNATPEMLAMALQQAGKGAEIEAAEEVPPPPPPQMPPPGPGPQAMPPQGPGPQAMPPQGPGPQAMPPQGPPGGPMGPPGMGGPGPRPMMPPGGPGMPPPGMGGPPPGMRPPGMPPPGMPPGGPPGQQTPVAQAAGQMAPPMPPVPLIPPGPLFNARICKIEEKTSVRVEAFAPDDLLIQRTWTSPLLQDCPYVARNMEVSLSDVHQMGFTDVTAEELAASATAIVIPDAGMYRDRHNGLTDYQSRTTVLDTADETQTVGYLRLEYVLVDFDDDGIAERREIYRLKDRILQNEECGQVPIATASPVLVPHRWDGMSIAEMVSDIQQLKTELTRQMLNNAYLANNPRKKILTDVNWSPLANIDDLLDGRPGGVLRQRQVDAITVDQTPWIGGNVFPILEYIDGMREQRTGLSKQSQGLDPNTLRPDRTATEIQMTMTAAKQRIRLIARILAECLMKPVFLGILKLLTEKGMPKLAFRLNGRFVQYDPNEWRDQYDMTINVGLGTGDRQQQHAMLSGILQSQMAIAQSPFGQLLVTPQTIYNTESKMVENAGFKNVGDFWINPQGKTLPPAQPPPDPALQVANIRAQSDQQKAQMQAQVDMQKLQLESQNTQRANDQRTAHEAALEQLRIHADQVQAQANLQLQASNDQRDAEREQLKAAYQAQLDQMRLRFDEWKAQLDSDTKIAVAQITAGAQIAVSKLNGEAPDPGALKQ